MRERELKSVVDDIPRRTLRLLEGGATLVFDGRACDWRFDTDERAVKKAGEMLRVRATAMVENGILVERAELTWKGPTSHDGGYKTRDEVTLATGPAGPLRAALRAAGYRVTHVIERDVRLLALATPAGEAIVRFETYPVMDTLVEVEGAPEAIERAIQVLGLPRDGFTAERFGPFCRRFTARTGLAPVLSLLGAPTAANAGPARGITATGAVQPADDCGVVRLTDEWPAVPSAYASIRGCLGSVTAPSAPAALRAPAAAARRAGMRRGLVRGGRR